MLFDPETQTVEVGSDEDVRISKDFGPLIFADLKIRAHAKECCWHIYRLQGTEWVLYARIPGQLEGDFDPND